MTENDWRWPKATEDERMTEGDWRWPKANEDERMTEPKTKTVGLCDWARSLRNCPVFHSADAVNPMGKLINCWQLLSKSDQPNALKEYSKTPQVC